MKILGLFFLWLATVAAAAQTDPAGMACRNHLRVFNGHSVDLTSLFQWWHRQPLPTNAAAYTSANIGADENADGSRPFAAWHRITGTHVGTVGESWVVQADIYTSPTARTNARIFLNHPPAVEEETYYTLKTQLAELDAQIADVRRVFQTNTNEEQQAVALVEMYRHSISKVAPTGVNVNSAVAQQKHDAAAEALSQMEQLEKTRQELQKQLKSIPSARENYAVDWFAVKLGYTKKGVPIYDMGLVSPLPP